MNEVYILNGREVSLDQISDAAEQSGISVEEYIQRAGVIKKAQDSTKTDPVEESQDAMGSELETGSSEQQETSWLRGEEGLVPDVIQETFKSKLDNIKKGLEDGDVDGIAEHGYVMFDAITNRLPKAFKEGWEEMEALEEKLTVRELGERADNETIQAVIDAHNKAKSTTPSKPLQRFYDIYAEENEKIQKEDPKADDMWGFLKAMKEEPLVLGEMLIRSAAGQVRGFFGSETTRTEALEGMVGGGGGALALNLTGVLAALPEEIVTVPTGIYMGGIGKLSQQIEMGTSMVEFLEEELDGEEFNLENVKKVLADPKKLERIQHRSYARGTAIGWIEAITGFGASKIVKGVRRAATGAKASTKAGQKIVGATGRVGGATAGVTAEMAGGGLGEIVGREVADQEQDRLEIGFEMFSGASTAPITVGTNIIGKSPKYTITDKQGKEKQLSYKEMKSFVDNATDMQIAEANVKIEGDNFLANKANTKQQNAIIDSSLDDRVSDPSDRKKLVELEKQRQQAEKESKLTGIRKKPKAKERLDKINNDMSAIIDKYADVDRRTKDVRARAKSFENLKKTVVKNLSRDIIKNKSKFAKAASKVLGWKTVQMFDNNESYIGAFVQEKMAEYMSGLTNEEVNDLGSGQIEKLANQFADLAENSDGVMLTNNADGSKRIMINVEKAAEVGAVNVAQHEVLHGVLKMALSKMDVKEKKKVISGFKQQIKTHLGENVVEEIENKLLSEYQKEIKEDSNFMSTTDEWFTGLSDIIDNDFRPDVTWDEVGKEHKNFFERMKDFIPPIFRKNTPYKKLSIETGEDAFNFMRMYSKNIKEGKLDKGMIAFAKGDIKPTTTQEMQDSFSRTADNTSFVNELSSFFPDKQSWDAPFGKFKSGSEYVVDEIVRNEYFDQLIASTLKVPRSVAETKNFIKKVYSELTSHIKNFNPEQNDNLFAYINSQVRNKAGVVYNRELKQDPALKDAKDVDATTPEGAPVTQIAAETTPDFDVDVDTKPIPKSERERVLRDFDIELDDGSFDAELTAEVEALIEENPDNLQERFDQLVEKDLRKKLDNSIGKIQKIDGKTVISPEYESFIRDEYAEIVQSLGINQIRTAYKNWFEKKRVGTEDVKKVDTETGKTTYFRKGIFENTTNKPKYIKYFTQGGFTTLRERRNALLKRIARRKAENAVDNYIQKNSKNIDLIVESKLRQLSKAADNVLNEKKSFDTVKFSRTMAKDIKSEAKMIEDLVQYDEKEKKYMGYINPWTNQPQPFLDIGRIYEQAYANYFIKMNLPGLKVISEMAGEMGGMADFVLRYKNNEENHELKVGLVGPWMGSAMLGFENGKIVLTKDTHQNLITKDVEAKVKEVLKQKADNFNKGIDRLNKETEIDSFNENKLKRPIFERFDLKKLLEGGETQYVPAELFDKKFLGGQNLVMIPSNEQPILNHYLNKKTQQENGTWKLDPVTSASFIGTNLGNISVRFSNDSMFNLPMFKANTMIHIGFRHRSKMVNGHKMRAVVVGMQFKVTELLNNPNEIMDITNRDDLQKALGAQFSKSPENTKILSDAAQFSRSSKNETRGMSAWDLDDTLARTKSGVRYTLPNKSGKVMPGRKVIFLAGGPGSGKSNVIKQLGLEKDGFKVVNQDISLEWLMKNHGLPTDMNDFTPEQASMFGKLGHEARTIAKHKKMKFQGKGDGIIVDGTGGSLNVMKKQVQEFKDKGYDVQMLFVETSLETALDRNKKRKERSLKDKIVERSHAATQSNKEGFKELFGDNFAEVNTDNLKQNDPMPSSLTSKMDKFTKSYIKGRLDAGEFASRGADILELGGKFDFAEFDQIVEGEQGPLFGKAMGRAKKFGLEDTYILTARPHAAKVPIYEFLKSQGLEIPLKNITTLENSTPEAKALWVAEKVGEGYNDIYFADDHLANVQAVENMLDQFDVKGKVQQAKSNFSRTMDSDFNKILEDVTKIDAEKRFSAAKARKRGEGKGKFRFFIPPSHEDFIGLLYNFMGKGERGNQHRNFFEKALLKPLGRAYTELNAAKQSIANDYKSLIKQFPDIRKQLTKKTPDGDFTYGDAMRVYLWDKNGFDVPGLSKTDLKELSDLVKSDPKLRNFADSVGIISKQKDGYVKPSKEWEIGDVRTDLAEATLGVGRQQFFTEFIENADIIFSKENLNKIEAGYGKHFREALEDMLYKIKNGNSRPTGSNRLVNRFTDWINGSVGSTMFLNSRSAILQQLSMVNFVNFADNNIFKAAKAFANQPQYWKDFAMIFNSDFLKQRRAGVGFDINGAELAQVVSKSKEPFRAAIKHLLTKGFVLTQLGDSNAIAMGGATFYRNRVNTYIKQGLNQKEAETKAFQDFRELAEMTQQSARPDMVSQQQSSALGKFILAFQNVTSQYNRFGIKRPTLDLINRRKTPPYTTQWQSDMSNMSRILYYGAVQNAIFYGLQTAAFAMLFDDDERDEEFFKDKKDRIVNGSIDSILRGSGIGGAIVSTLKNAAMKIAANEGKTWNKATDVLVNELLQLSPPLGIKARKLSSAEKTMKYNKKVIEEMETFDIDNPHWDAVTNVIEGTTNAPTNALYRNTMNVREGLNAENEYWQRLFLFMGWSQWQLGVENKEVEAVKQEIKTRENNERILKKLQNKKRKGRTRSPRRRR